MYRLMGTRPMLCILYVTIDIHYVSATSGIVKKLSWTILLLRPVLNCCTWGRTYSRNASELHRPCSIIVEGSTFRKYRSIAKLVLIECVPTRASSNPKTDFPTLFTKFFRWSETSFARIAILWLFSSQYVSTGVSRDPFSSKRMRHINSAHAITGRISRPDACCVMVIYFSRSFGWWT